MLTVTSKKKRFTVREYLKMDRAGIFGDQRVELVMGRILKMHAQNYSHRTLLSRVNTCLVRRFPDEAFWAVVQGTLQLGKFGAPEPDFGILDVPCGTPEPQLPLPFLIIEISDTTYRRDAGAKLQQYAAAGIQDYWIVNATQEQIEVYRQPVGRTDAGVAGYLERKVYKRGEAATCLRFPDFQIAVTHLFPDNPVA